MGSAKIQHKREYSFRNWRWYSSDNVCDRHRHHVFQWAITREHDVSQMVIVMFLKAMEAFKNSFMSLSSHEIGYRRGKQKYISLEKMSWENLMLNYYFFLVLLTCDTLNMISWCFLLIIFYCLLKIFKVLPDFSRFVLQNWQHTYLVTAIISTCKHLIF